MARIKLILVMVLVGGTAVLMQLARGETAVAQPHAATVILYDAALNTGTPDTQEMVYLTQPSPPFPPSQASQTFSNTVTILDTTATNEDYAGYFGPEDFADLDRSLGYQVNFTVKLDSESHANSNRAGFSLIVLSNDIQGIELGFWQDEVWAQHDDTTGTLFTHGEGAALATAVGLIAYELTVISDTYTLAANNVPVLTGPLRDYSSFTGIIDPYEIPNLLFLGDDTTSAQARIQLSYVAVTVNEPPLEPTNFLYLPLIMK